MSAWEGQAIMGTTPGTDRIAHRAAALVIGSIIVLGPAVAREITLDDRVEAAKAIEQVYFDHRTWPEGNPAPKPPLSSIATEASFRARVVTALRESARLAAVRGRVPTGDELQAEIARMVRDSKAPTTLSEIFAALGADPFLIAECLARPTPEARLWSEIAAADPELAREAPPAAFDASAVRQPVTGYVVPAFPEGAGCTPDTWSLSSLTTATGANFPS